MTTTTLTTPAGPFTIVAFDKTVLAAGFTEDADALVTLIHPQLREDSTAVADFDPIVDAVNAYFDGDLTALDAIDVLQTGGVFIEDAWAALRGVPGGEPITYTQLASRAGRPAAVRGAAQACARNAAALFVPCHRVIRGDGSLGGYRYGLEIKQHLLAHERGASAKGLVSGAST